MDSFDPLSTSASELQKALKSGRLTTVTIAETYLKEIEKNNGYLKAVIATAPKTRYGS